MSTEYTINAVSVDDDGVKYVRVVDTKTLKMSMYTYEELWVMMLIGEARILNLAGILNRDTGLKPIFLPIENIANVGSVDFVYVYYSNIKLNQLSYSSKDIIIATVGSGLILLWHYGYGYKINLDVVMHTASGILGYPHLNEDGSLVFDFTETLKCMFIKGRERNLSYCKCFGKVSKDVFKRRLLFS